MERMSHGGQQQDGWPAKTSPSLAVKDHSKKNDSHLKAEDQAQSLINFVLAGVDPDQLMNATVEQIHESGAGPWAIGSRLKINKAVTAEKVGGGSVSLSKGDVVSVVMPNLGEQGQDRMVLLSDGATKAIVPFDALGEGLEEMGSLQGPAGHAVPSAGGKAAQLSSKAQGDKEPKAIPAVQKKGAGSAQQLPSRAQGQSEPSMDASAQKMGSKSAQQLPAKAQEAKREVLAFLDEMMDSSKDFRTYRKVNEVRRKIDSLESRELFSKLHDMLFSETEQFSLDQVDSLVSEAYGNPHDDRDKKKPFGGMKKASDKSESTPKPLPTIPSMGVVGNQPKSEASSDDHSASMKSHAEKGKKVSGLKDPPAKDQTPGKVKPAPGLKEAYTAKLGSMLTRLDELATEKSRA